jgi:hypothetical protein
MFFMVSHTLAYLSVIVNLVYSTLLFPERWMYILSSGACILLGTYFILLTNKLRFKLKLIIDLIFIVGTQMLAYWWLFLPEEQQISIVTTDKTLVVILGMICIQGALIYIFKTWPML